MKHLYKNFLQDQRVYNLNEAFYKRLVEAVTGSEAFHFFRSRYANGQKIYDGHIFSTRYEGRILQVIQREPDSDYPVLRARHKKWDGQYDMLVLTLELSEEIKLLLKKIVKAWLVEKTAFEEISSMLPGSPMSNYENSNPAPVVNDDGE
ncbi:MAG: hypothetical protein H6559_01250 [Lewinellaceae bacterium]|nr:hypothetical protein [Lewinellaceae bacterium]